MHDWSSGVGCTGGSDRERPASRRSLAGLFLLSLATLLLEMALTRVLSVSLWYHFGFLVISTVLLGFGAAGVTVALSRKLRAAVPAEELAVWCCLGFATAALGGFWLLQRIPFDPFGLLADRRQMLLTPLAYLCLAAPFYAAGIAIAALLGQGGRDVPRLYAADLCGAAAGCVAMACVMPCVGGSGSVVTAVAVACAAAAVFAVGRKPRLVALSTMLALGSAASAPYADTLLPITITPNKRFATAVPIYSAWNTFSRIDVYETPPSADNDNTGSRSIVIDKGTARTGIRDLRPSVKHVLSKPENSSDLATSAVYVGKQHPKVLVIGSGGGNDVLEGLRFGARSVVAVEVNPIINDIVSNRMAEFWGGLFSRPEVRLVTEEGRSFVRRSRERYDVIVSTHAITNAALAARALGLAENYLLTREAFEDYVDHLEPDGAMFLTRPEAQLPRLVATAREAFETRGLVTLRDRLVVFRARPAAAMARRYPGIEQRKTFAAGIVVRTRAFDSSEIDEIERRLGVGLPTDPRALYHRPEILYAPGPAPLGPCVRAAGEFRLAGALRLEHDGARARHRRSAVLQPARPIQQHVVRNTGRNPLGAEAGALGARGSAGCRGDAADSPRPVGPRGGSPDPAPAVAFRPRRPVSAGRVVAARVLRGSGARLHHDRDGAPAAIHAVSGTARLLPRGGALGPAAVHGRRFGALRSLGGRSAARRGLDAHCGSPAARVHRSRGERRLPRRPRLAVGGADRVRGGALGAARHQPRPAVPNRAAPCGLALRGSREQ